jgi:hypothetical protein
MADQLNDHNHKYQRILARIVLLEDKIRTLGAESGTWEKRSRSTAVAGDAELAREVARICGRLEGYLSAAKSELTTLAVEETHLRELLSRGYRDYKLLAEDLLTLGHDVLKDLEPITFERPAPAPDPDIIPDDETDFVERVVDGSETIH